MRVVIVGATTVSRFKPSASEIVPGMAASPPRRVRLARAGRPAEAAPSAPPAGVASETPRRLPNRSATRRARRLAFLYIAGLAVLYLAFALLARASPGGHSTGTSDDLAWFGAIAFAFALGGAVLTLLSAPSAFELTDGATVVVSPFGTRRTFPTGPGLSVRVVRRFPPGLLSEEPVEVVELAWRGVRRTYHVDAGVFAEAGAR